MKTRFHIFVATSELGEDLPVLNFESRFAELAFKDDNSWSLSIAFARLPITPQSVAKGYIYVDDIRLGDIDAVEMRIDKNPARLTFSGKFADDEAWKLEKVIREVSHEEDSPGPGHDIPGVTCP